MTHTDASDRSWELRIGTNGNIYSHYTSDMYGETLPPQNQNNADAPWVDEVQQSVSVNGELNQLDGIIDHPEYCDAEGVCSPYYIHQAGAYQRDAPDTVTPFYSPSLAKHCEGNTCMFASWGTQAHVATPFTSPIIYVNKYVNCDGGIIEHTQMIHNFADPTSPLSTATNVDQTYFNVGWGGVRSSTLPFALEPNPTTGTLDYTDVNTVDYLPLCKWGDGDHDNPNNAAAGRGARADLKDLGGYSTFVQEGLLVNRTIPKIELACRIASDPTCVNSTTCMVESCTEVDITNGYTRIELKVQPKSSPNCVFHAIWNGLVSLQCNMRDTLFGRTNPSLSSADPCAPWTNVGFYNEDTGEGLDVAFVRHWSYSPNNRRTYFAVYVVDDGTVATRDAAAAMVNAIFNNGGNADPLSIAVRPTSNIEEVPPSYDPASLNAFTFVYGDGAEYDNGGLTGRTRRRVGSTVQGVGKRDYTVFTINWWDGARLQPGSTYVKRGYMFISDLGSVKTTADSLVNEVFVDQIDFELWSPRAVDVYTKGTNFVVMTAPSSAPGSVTTCASTSATNTCSGFSTPQSGHVPFFYVSCGTNTYFGLDPYHFTPAFGGTFPGHGDVNNTVRSYLCDGELNTVRPSWKLMGFFNATDTGCASLTTTTYEETTCDPDPSTNGPTDSPSKSPSEAPTKQPTAGPTDQPTDSPTKQPTASPVTDSPSKSPSLSPSKSPTNQPTKQPTASPSAQPSAQPSEMPSGQPSEVPSEQSSGQPSGQPSSQPSTNSPTKRPTASPVTNSPTKSPSSSPSKSPTNQPTASPMTLPKDGWCSDGTGRCSDVDMSECACSTSPNENLFERMLLIKGGESPRKSTPSLRRKLPKKTAEPTTPVTSLPPVTSSPTSKPTNEPTPPPSKAPSPPPTGIPTGPSPCLCLATAFPTSSPTDAPTKGPMLPPTPSPTSAPTQAPIPPPSSPPTTCPVCGDGTTCCPSFGTCETGGKPDNRNCIPN
jgi:hypothetical protein